MRNSLVLLLFFSYININLFSQKLEIEQEIGIGAGFSNYFGDLNDHFGFKGVSWSSGIFLRQNIGKRFAFRTSFNYLKVGYKDEYADRLFNKNRNLSFHSNIYDINAQIEFNFLNFVRSVYYNKEGSAFSPYLSFGFGVFFFNPQTTYEGKTYNLQPLGTEGQTDPDYTRISKYNLYSFALVYGGGLKYHVSKNISVGLDFSIRRTFTDYLDDVSGYYSPIISLPEADKGIAAKLHNRSPEVGDFTNKTGKMRGTLDGNDDFATLQFSISWNFLNNACKNNF